MSSFVQRSRLNPQVRVASSPRCELRPIESRSDFTSPSDFEFVALGEATARVLQSLREKASR
jgi:hypothetical protein